MRDPKDLLTGLILFAIGAGALTMAMGYRLGSPTQMGPGYFPAIVAGLLTLVGMAILGKALVTQGPRLEQMTLRPLALIVGATLAFAFVLKPLGLVPAVLVLVLVSAYASKQFSPARHIALATSLSLACYLLFVRFLGLPLQALGPLVGG